MSFALGFCPILAKPRQINKATSMSVDFAAKWIKTGRNSTVEQREHIFWSCNNRWDMFWYNLITRLSARHWTKKGKMIVKSCFSLEGLLWSTKQHLLISPPVSPEWLQSRSFMLRREKEIFQWKTTISSFPFGVCLWRVWRFHPVNLSPKMP